MAEGVDVPIPSEDPMTSNVPQLPWNQIPRFIPGTTNVQEYTAKLRFLASMWPSSHLDQLAPRAALMVEGTAFRKVARIPPSKLKVNTTDGVAALVAAIGGSWGSTELEERYEYFEKALYGTIQRSDESHDSFLSRMEANFVELLARETKLEEVQAYVLLRQSLLSAEDKKKILLEHGGNLRYDPVVKSFRLLGSRFFSELQGNKQHNRSKVYDANLTENNEPDAFQNSMDVSEKAFHAYADDPDEIDGDYLDALVASEDPDALVVQNFEQELEEFLQEVPGMHDAMTTYLEARQKLVQKRTSRGFWPIKGKASGKGRGANFKGKGRGKGRDSLLQRIARSYCRLCNQKGHWKDECPKKGMINENGSLPAAANLAEMTGLDRSSEDVLVINELPNEVVSDDDYEPSELSAHSPEARPKFCTAPKISGLSCSSCPAFHNMNNCQEAFLVRELLGNNHRDNLQKRISKFVQTKKFKPVFFPHRSVSHFRPCDRTADQPVQDDQQSKLPDRCPAATEVATCFVSSSECPSLAILDTGASRCVIGENVWKQVLHSLPDVLQKQIRQHDSQVKFRFGNNQSLTSSFRVQVPLLNHSGKKRLWLSIEVVPGNTPFLFSKRAFKQLGGVLNTTDDTCFLHRLNRSIELSLSKTELYLIDIAKLCLPDTNCPTNSVSESFHAGVTERHVSVEYDTSDAVDHVSHPLAKLSSEKTSVLSQSISESVRHASRADACHLEGNCRDASEPLDFVAAGDDASDRVKSGCGIRRGESTPIGDPSHDDQYDARTAGSTKSTTRDDEPAKSNLTFRGHPWTFNRTSFQPYGRESTSRASFDTTANRCYVSSVMVSSGGRRDPGGRSNSQLQSSSRSSHQSCGAPVDASSVSTSGIVSSSCHTVESSRNHGNCDSSCSADSCSQHGGMGKENYHLGKEASRTEFPLCPNSRSWLCDLEHGSLQDFASRPTRFLSVLPADGIKSQLKMDPRSCIGKDFRRSVAETRTFLKQKNPNKVINPAMSNCLDHAVRVAEEAFVSPQSSVVSEPLILLEIYANENSSLTDAFLERGLPAMRFTKKDGGLATVHGRRKLWDIISKHQPEYIWVAPECGPWSGWSRLNQFKSLRLFDKIESERQRQRIHIELCAKLCRFQKDRNRHFCLEQPLSSQMPTVEDFQDIHKNTVKASFDMCAFGLKIPGTDRFLRKSSMVYTTDDDLACVLEKFRCPHNHEHQPIAGSVSVKHQRQALSQFCASYCRGFAVKIAGIIGRRFQQAFHEDETPSKKPRLSRNFQKRPRLDGSSTNRDPIDLDAVDELAAPGTGSSEPDPNQAPAESAGRPSGSEISWNSLMSMADRCAPRVGNIKFGADSEMAQNMQCLVPGVHIQWVFVCRGTERFQLPSQVNADFPIRYTVCQHRHNGTIHDFGAENWTELKRSLRIRASIPSKVCLTAFGTSLNVPIADSPSVPPLPVDARAVAPPNVDQPNLPVIPEEPNEPVSSISSMAPKMCEGWAPPPTPLHGPKYRSLSAQEKSDLALLHRNLGHPDPNVLSAHLKVQGAAQHIVEAALEYVCDTCVESVSKRHQRPAKLHEPLEFNQLVGIDGFFWSGKQGFQVHVLHCIDEASLFHMGRRARTRNPDQTMNLWNDFWTSWAGNPQKIYSDPAGEFRSREWKTALQARNICPEITTEAWQRGRVERHGGIIKQMISRYDLESTIQTPEQFDQILTLCFQAKNALSRHQGYSPEQIVLGKSVPIPASICSDENVGAHSLALGEDQDSERFRRHLEQRSRARRAFLLTDNDQALRRALLRKSRPTRGPFLPNQLVMYWMKRSKSSRHECGRWHGPAKVILQESNAGVWISHMDRLFRCAPESLRPASLREWNASSDLSISIPQNIIPEPSNVHQPGITSEALDSNNMPGFSYLVWHRNHLPMSLKFLSTISFQVNLKVS